MVMIVVIVWMGMGMGLVMGIGVWVGFRAGMILMMVSALEMLLMMVWCGAPLFSEEGHRCSAASRFRSISRLFVEMPNRWSCPIPARTKSWSSNSPRASAIPNCTRCIHRAKDPSFLAMNRQGWCCK